MSSIFDVGALAKENPSNATTAFERAMEWARGVIQGEGSNARPQVYVPSGTYLLTRPIFVPNGTTIFGDGHSSSIVSHDSYTCPAFIFGVRAEHESVLNAARPLVPQGVYDVPINDVHALKTDALYAQDFHDDVALGPWKTWRGFPGHDYWETTDQLTIDVMLDRIEGNPWRPGHVLVGLGDFNGPTLSAPWCLRVGDTVDELLFTIADERWDADDDYGGHGWRIDVSGQARPWRLTIQVDLRDGVFGAWVNRVAVATTRRNEGPGYDARPFGPGHRLRSAVDYPLVFGGSSRGITGTTVPPNPAIYYGFKACDVLKYEWSTAGQPLRRLDQTPINDGSTYFYNDPNALGRLGLFGAPNGRQWVDMIDHQSRVGAALLIGPGQAGGAPVAISDLRIDSNGPCVAIGAVLGMTAERLHLTAKRAPCIASLQTIAAYPIRVRDCFLDSTVACVDGFRWSLFASGNHIGRSGRDAWRLRGCRAVIRDTWHDKITPHAETAVAHLPEFTGGHLHVDNMNINTEGPGFKHGVVRALTSRHRPVQLLVEGLTVGTTKRDDQPEGTLVLLDRGGDGLGTALIQGCQAERATHTVDVRSESEWVEVYVTANVIHRDD